MPVSQDSALLAVPPEVPFKTAMARDELARRGGGLTQRHRTVLLLVDGRRSASQVLALALQAGAAEAHFHELVASGMIGFPSGGAGSGGAGAPA